MSKYLRIYMNDQLAAGVLARARMAGAAQQPWDEARRRAGAGRDDHHRGRGDLRALKTYWSLPDRQLETSVVLTNPPFDDANDARP